MQRIVPFLLVLFVLMPVSELFSQDYDRIRRELRERQTETNQEIRTLQQLITQYEQEIRQTDDQYESLYQEFQELEREISVRDAIIRSLQTQGRQINEEMNVIQREIRTNRDDLERLIETYQASLTYLYKHGRVPELAYIFTSGSFNQMLVRSFYLQRFQEQRERQAAAIEEKQEELRVKEEELAGAREDVNRNLAQTRTAREGLSETRRRQDQTIVRLRENREQTQQKLEDSRRAVQNLNNILNNTIAELERVQREEEERIRALEAERLRRLAEARRIQDAAEREREVARYSEPVTRTSSAPTREALAVLELSFVRSKGSMRWPVTGVITQEFGYRINPVSRTRIPSPGIEITADEASSVYAIHDGYVSQIYRGVPDFGDMIIIKHGESYYTVYTNFSNIQAVQDMYVREGDIIGQSGTRTSERGSTLYFMVRRSGADSNLNPVEWIRKQESATR
ncbi:MAG: peptidoglycan DD-metalloendopeptidase family protein [Balneolales bacterium]|nr:peptidoglycan DD-metalloendopeptidase family protein [Balneolales bacterium]